MSTRLPFPDGARPELDIETTGRDGRALAKLPEFVYPYRKRLCNELFTAW